MALKKHWYDIVAPSMFENKVIGETLTADPKQLIGRKIEVSVMDLTNDYSKFYMKVQFQIEKLDGNKAHTKFIGHYCMRERIYRMIQRRIRRVDSIQDVKTKDGKTIRVKTVFILLKRINTSVKDATRRKSRELIDKIAGETDFNDFIKLIIKGELQQKIRKDVSKVYPIGDLEIRKTELKESKVLEKAKKEAK